MMIAKGIRFLTILAVLAVSFAACAAVMTPADAAGTEWEGGTLYLKNGEVYKLSGDIIEDSYFEKDPSETSSDFSATVVIEAGDSKSLTIENGITLEVKAGIAVEIEGTVTGEGTLKVAKSITVKDGGVLSSRVISAETNTAYSGGNINHATIDDFSKWAGKDAAEGYWTYNDKTLALNGYSGTYNFAGIDGSLTGIMHIELNGDNAVTLSEPIFRDIDDSAKVVNALIGGYSLCSIATDGEGSLTFNVDVSKVEGEHLSKHTAAIYGPVTIIDGVTVNINVSGSNPDWTAEQKEIMNITGLEDTANLEALNSIINVSVMSGYDSRNITGVFVAGDLNIFGKTLQAEATLAIQADNISIRMAVVTAKGDVLIYDNSGEKLGDLNATSIGTFNIDGTLRAKDVSASQKSLIGFKDAKIEGDLKNKGIMKVVGNVMVSGSFENYAEMRNDGSIGIYGAFINNQMTSLMPAVFTNNGTFEVFALKQRSAGVPAVPVTTADLSIDDTSASVNYAKIRSIHITDAVQDYNGSISFNATITVYKSEGYSDVSDTFEGSVSPGPNGYTLTLYSSTASVTIVYDSTVTEGPTKVGKAYAVYVSGTVKAGDDTLRLQDNSSASGSEATVTADTVKQGGLYDISGADFDIIGGSFYSYGEVEVGSSSDAKIIGAYGAFYGDMTTNISDVTLEGLFNGVLTANGDGMATVANVVGDVHSSGSVTVTGTMDGSVFAKGDVTVEGSLSGDIATFGSVDIKSMTGAVIITRSSGDHGNKTLRVDGDSSVSLDYITNYKSTKDAKETTQYTASLNIAGTPKGLVIGLAEGSDATASSDAVPGYFVFKSMEALDVDKETDIVLTEGRVLVDSAVTLESRYCLRIQAGTTIEVIKTGGSLDVRKGSLKVSKDANALFETGSGIPEKYGKVLFIMSVEVEGGAYTVYSDVAYALLNCSEGAELVAGGSAEVDQDVVVKKDVNIVVGDVTLTFSGRNVEMEDGARITIKGAGKVVFKESGDNHSSVKEGEVIVYYSVSGAIVYGDNTAKFEKVRFTNDSAVQGTAESKIKTDLEYDEGIFTIAAGTGTGTITLKNDINDVTKSENPEKIMVFGTFLIASGTVFDSVAINDSAAQALYKAYTAEPQIDRYVMYPTSVEVEGALNLTSNTTVYGDYSGSGKVTLAEGRMLTLDKAELPEPEAVKTVPGNLNIGVVDTAAVVNGYVFNGVSSCPGIGEIILTPGTITIDGEKVGVMKIKGSLYTGIVKAVRAACLDGLRVFESAAIFGDDVYVISESSTLEGGYVAAKTIHKHDKPFADLIYDTVFDENGYTIYAMFGSIDWDEVSDVIIADDVTVDTLDLSGRDVNIVVADGAELKVTKLLIIGSPATNLGGEGSSITGKVTIVEGLGAYIVAYADVNLSSAEIVTWTDVPAPRYSDPVSSKLEVDYRNYASIYSAEADNLELAKVDSFLRPVIVGYMFTSWLNYNGDAQAKVGETDAYAGMRATNVTVTVKFTEGVSVYCNGEEFNMYNAPIKVKFNSVFYAKISDTSKYEGTPLINGKNSFIVTEDVTLTVSGVTPIPEPTPKPGSDSGLSLINILLIVLVVLVGIMAVILFLRLRSV